MVAATIGAALLAFLLYWPSLSLPIIFDDLLHIRIAQGLNPFTVWLPTEQFGFYRPLTFVPLLIIDSLFGYYPDWLLHGLNVAQHSLNVILLITLTWRVERERVTAVVAGILFAVFPFSYQAVAVYGHNVHPTLTGLILLGMHAYLTASRSAGKQHSPNGILEGGRRRLLWWGVTGFLFLLSLLAHESAVLFGAFAALVYWSSKGRLPQLKRSFTSLRLAQLPPWLILLEVGLLYTAIYQLLPLAPTAAASQAGEGLVVRAYYVLQAAAYPFTWFAHRLPQIDANSLILGGVALTGLLILWTGLNRENRILLFLGWAWWALATMVVVIPLSTPYVLHGPRLLYLGSVGLAWVWATILTKQRPELPKYIWLLGGTAFILATNWQFVRDRVADYTRLTEPVEVIENVMEEESTKQGIVVVNLPQWISPARNTYAIGAELAAMLGHHLFADELVSANLRGGNAVFSVVLPDLLRTTDYAYDVHDETRSRGDAAATLPIRSDWAETGSQVFIVNYGPSGPQTTHTGALQPLQSSRSPLARLGPYELMEARAVGCNGMIQATFVWIHSFSESILPTTSIFVQLLSEDGRPLTQADGPPLGLRPDLVRLLPGWQIKDQRTLHLSEEGEALSLLVGAYDFTTGHRLPAFDSRGKPLSDDAFRIEVTACS